MGIDEIESGQRWKLINIINRPDVIVKNVDKYSNIVYWSYENESRINESEVNYFIKQFKKVE